MNILPQAFFQIQIVSVLRYLIIAGIPFLVFYKLLPARYKASKIQHKQPNSKDFWRELWHSVQTTVVFSVIGLLIFFTPLKTTTLIYDDANAYPFWWGPLSLLLTFVIHDTYFYWMHRLLHHPKLFALTHLVHHKSTNPTPLASYSFHLTEAFTEGAVLFVLVYALPLHQLTIIAFIIGGLIINAYGHLGHEIAPQWLRRTWLFEVINTSVHHNLHHRKFNGNYGLYFRFWDRVMKTEFSTYVADYDKVQQAKKDKPEAELTEVFAPHANN